MKSSIEGFVARLIARVPADLARGLGEDPLGAIEGAGIKVVPMDALRGGDDCGCDGAFFRDGLAAVPTIAYVPTPGTRRENFTLLHEYAHALVAGDDDTLSDLADFEPAAGRDPEEQICDVFAGKILVSADRIAAVLGGKRPRARHLGELFAATQASQEACAVRLAERLPAFGYVAILDAAEHAVRFAAAAPNTRYRWRRGSRLRLGHPAWMATPASPYRGQAEVTWPSGQSLNVFVDVVVERFGVVAVFSDEKYWSDGQLSILDDAPVAKAETYGVYSTTCRHCGGDAWGKAVCITCGDPQCGRCKRCSCGAPKALQSVCSRCSMIKSRAEMVRGETWCRACAS